jgi:F-box-like
MKRSLEISDKYKQNKHVKCIIPQLPSKIINSIFNHINDPKEFGRLSRVNKKWKTVLDHHYFWKNLIEDLNLSKPNSRAMKYKTYKSIFIKNINNLCFCKTNFAENNKSIKKIHLKLTRLKSFCEERIDFYWQPKYIGYCINISNQIDKIIQKSKINKRCEDCDNKNELIKLLYNLIRNIYHKKGEFEKNNNFSFSKWIEEDFVKVIIYNIYKIIQDENLYIKRFGGIQYN